MSDTVANGLYWVARQILRMIQLLQSMFDLFAGGSKVSFHGKNGYLTNLFFSNDTVVFAYEVVAVIGSALAVGFALAAFLRRIFDPGGRGQMTLGRILTAMVKSILLIAVTNSLVTMVFSATNMLLSYIHYTANLETEARQEVVLDDRVRAAMARALNTLGNYSLNESYQDTLNVNLCFNEMRSDMQLLDNAHVFEADYAPEKNGDSWQSVLALVANAADLSREMELDEEDPQLSGALIQAMDILRKNQKLPLLQGTTVDDANTEASLSFDTVLFLLNTMDAARNTRYNEAPDVSDALRGDYYTGKKSIYDVEAVSASFDLSKVNFFILYLSAAEVVFSLVVMIFNCITRIFSMIFLYIISPGFFAIMPFDDGARTRAWIRMFLVQALTVFAAVIPMKLIILFVPIILDMGLQLFEDPVLNQTAKLLLILGAFEAARRASTILAKLITESNPGSVLGSYEIKTLSKTLSKSLGKEIRKAVKKTI